MSDVLSSTRSQILDAAEGLFARKGYDATTIKEIGRASGVNPALLYYYFAGREDLYKAVLQRLFDTILSQGGAVLDGSVPQPEPFRRRLALQPEGLLPGPIPYGLLVRYWVDH